MKVNSCYTVYGFDDINVALKIYVDIYGCKVLHHPAIPNLEYYVVEDESGNRTDLVSGDNAKSGDRWVRINVDNLEEALADFTANGAKIEGEIIDTPYCKLAFVIVGNDKTNKCVVFQHKKA